MSNKYKKRKEIEKKDPGSSKIALIYCRVSSERQKNEGHGLDSQEQRCREYARQKGYAVEMVFRDSHTGGGDFLERPAMVLLLKHADDNAHKNYIVIFDDLSRFARDVVFHIKLKQEFGLRNIKPECLNFNFDDSPEGEMVELMMAAQNQYHRKSNRRQVIQKERSRLEAGYWTFYPPPGYIHIKDSVHGKLLTPTDKADMIKEAFEGFASGRFRSQEDVRKFLQERRFSGGKSVWLETVKRLLSRVIYAGYIEYPGWGVERRIGHHKAIISLETYEKVQEKLGRRTFKRVIENEDFAVRGLVNCSVCRRPMTAGWTKGRSKRYPYYKCQYKYCKSKEVPRSNIEDGLEKVLENIQPKNEAVLLVEAIISDVWHKRINDQEGTSLGLKSQRKALEADKDRLIDNSSKINSEAFLKGIEMKVEKIEKEILELDNQINKTNLTNDLYGTASEYVLSLLKNPVFTWQNGGYKGKRLITKLVFVDNPIYDRNLQYGTAELSLGVRLFELILAQESQDVEMVRIELTCK